MSTLPSENVEPTSVAAASPSYTRWQLVRYMLGLGTWGFGGPVALVGYMYRDLVERRRWIAESDYKEGMALAQLMPGPLAAQLAIYLGYVHYRVIGATLAGVAFVLALVRDGRDPRRCLRRVRRHRVDAGGVLRRRRGGDRHHRHERVEADDEEHRQGRAALGHLRRERARHGDHALRSRVALSRRGIVVWLWRVPPDWLQRGKLHSVAGPLAALLGTETVDWHKLGQIGAYFAYAGSFVFGSGLAIVPFLYGGVVKEYGWLTDRQFVDAVAVAMITPGPVVITTGFIGYLVAGFWGAVVAALATFVPCYLFTIVPAPYFKKHGKRPAIVAFVDGVTAAAIGAIAGAVVVIGQRSITDWITAALAVATAACCGATRSSRNLSSWSRLR
jgi:chromate transporter